MRLVVCIQETFGILWLYSQSFLSAGIYKILKHFFSRKIGFSGQVAVITLSSNGGLFFLPNLLFRVESQHIGYIMVPFSLRVFFVLVLSVVSSLQVLWFLLFD